MNESELNHLYITIPKGLKNNKDLILEKAFEIYNKGKARPLSMGCLVCYFKVYQYCLENANI